MEETALKMHGSPLACAPTWGVVTSLAANAPDPGAVAPGRYYVLLPMQRRRVRRGGGMQAPLRAFGPFVSSEAVNFIRTSAVSLGLL